MRDQAGAFSPGANAFYTAATAENANTSKTVVIPDPPAADETPIDTNMLLAAALGACKCWGLLPNCHLCRGCGSTGWLQPDLELFEEFVRPAIARLSPISAGGYEQHGNVKADQDSDNHQTVKGEKP